MKSIIKRILKLLFGAGLVVLGSVFIWGGTVRMPADMAYWADHGVSAEGTIIGFQTRNFSNRRAAYPVIEYRTQEGHTCRFTANTESTPFETYSVNQRVRIKYKADEPGFAFIDTTFQRWLPVAILLIMGLIFFASGAGLVWWGIKQKK